MWWCFSACGVDLSAAPEGAMPGFVDYMYKNILPACFLAPLKPTFDLNDGNSFVVRGIQCSIMFCSCCAYTVCIIITCIYTSLF